MSKQEPAQLQHSHNRRSKTPNPLCPACLLIESAMHDMAKMDVKALMWVRNAIRLELARLRSHGDNRRKQA